MILPNSPANNNDPHQDPKKGQKSIFDQTEDVLSNLRKVFATGRGENEKDSESLRRHAGFFSAVRRRDIPRVKKFLKEGLHPNVFNQMGETALHICAHIDAADVAGVLIQAGADPLLGTKDDAHKIPIMGAVKFGKLKMVTLLTRMGGYAPNKTSVDGKTLLHVACTKGKVDMARAFIEAGANPNSQTANGTTPLLIALHYEQVETALYLLTLPDVVAQMNTFYTKTDPLKNTAFQKAVSMGMTTIIDRMIETGAHINMPDAEKQTPLGHAVEKRNLKLAKALIKAGADINKVPSQKYHPLILACEKGDYEYTENSVTDHRLPMINMLLQLGANPDVINPVNGHSPLHYILKTEENISTLKSLLAYPLNTEIFDAEGATPLFYVLQKGQEEKLALLLQKSANPNALHGYDGRTPLIDAVQKANLKAVDMLLRAGADPYLCDAENRSALFYADQIKEPQIQAVLQKAILKDYTALQAPAKISNNSKSKNNLRPKP